MAMISPINARRIDAGASAENLGDESKELHSIKTLIRDKLD